MKALFDFKGHFEAFREITLLLTRHRQLTWEMTKREISDRYAGQVFGTIWAVCHPLILMAVYLFIFGFVFKTKVGGTPDLPLDYTTYLLSGLIPWMAFQDSMGKSATVIVSNASLVKQIVFPIEILPVKGVIASFITQLISIVIFIMYVLLRYKTLPFTYIFIPVLFLFQLTAMIGVSYIFSAVGVYFKDLKDFVQVFCVVGMYIMPLFYLPAMVPKIFQPVLYMNPFSYLTWCCQDIFYFGRFEHRFAWAVFMVGSIAIFYGGYMVFKKLKIMFGNAL